MAAAPGATAATGGEEDTSEEAMLQRALAMSMDTTPGPAAAAASAEPDLSAMTEVKKRKTRHSKCSDRSHASVSSLPFMEL